MKTVYQRIVKNAEDVRGLHLDAGEVRMLSVNVNILLRAAQDDMDDKVARCEHDLDRPKMSRIRGWWFTTKACKKCHHEETYHHR